MVLVIGVAGSIATGKSTACEVIVAQGAHHCDADRLVHRLYDPGTDAFDRIVAIFGNEIVGDDGYIDRRILGGKVFGKPEEMNKLTTAIGSISDAVKSVVNEWRETLGPDDVALMEAVNLIEAGYGQWCDQVWLFACDEDIARQRLAARNQLSTEEVEKRLASQRSWEDRAIASDIVTMNNGTEDDFKHQVRNQYRSIIQLASLGELETSKYNDWWKEYVREREAQKTESSD
jgi:dephospho-CoA kinase